MKLLKFENLGLHVKIWAFYILYERLYVFFLQGTAGNVWNGIAIYIQTIAFFYFNAHVIFPSATNKGHVSYTKLIFMMIGETAVFIFCRFLIIKLLTALNIPVLPPFINWQLFIFAQLIRTLYLLGLSTGYWFALSTYYNRQKVDELQRKKLKDELETQQLEKNLLITENAYLKSQINPHFLLNTLNFLYSSVLKYNEQVADSFMALADIMRYALTNAGEDGKVALYDELEHVANFIKLNQVRFNQRLCVDFIVNGDPGTLRIIPLVLMTLVENVFKYGDLLNPARPVRIIAHIDENNLTFVTYNLKRKRVLNISHRIGLKNIRNRLTMYHPFELDIDDSETTYESTLKIQL